jgi:hypothetical protein
VAAELGRTPENVRQIQRRAVGRLAKSLAALADRMDVIIPELRLGPSPIVRGFQATFTGSSKQTRTFVDKLMSLRLVYIGDFSSFGMASKSATVVVNGWSLGVYATESHGSVTIILAKSAGGQWEPYFGGLHPYGTCLSPAAWAAIQAWKLTGYTKC